MRRFAPVVRCDEQLASVSQVSRTVTPNKFLTPQSITPAAEDAGKFGFAANIDSIFRLRDLSPGDGDSNIVAIAEAASGSAEGASSSDDGAETRIAKRKSRSNADTHAAGDPIPTGHNETIVIVGAGAAGLAAAEALRHEAGFAGKIKLLTREPPCPFRPYLSKQPTDETALQSASMLLKEWDVEVIPNTDVTLIDTEVKAVHYKEGIYKDSSQAGVGSSAPSFSAGTLAPSVGSNSKKKGWKQVPTQVLAYDKVLLATGSRNKSAYVPGSQNQENVFSLRSADDQLRLLKKSGYVRRGAKAVLIGGGFTGLELADMLNSRYGVQVTLIDKSPLPFQKKFGKRVGAAVAKHLAQNRILYFGNTTVRQFKGGIGKVNAVELDTGDVLPCDFVVVSVGTQPEPPLIQPPVAKGSDGSLLVDPFLASRGANQPSTPASSINGGTAATPDSTVAPKGPSLFVAGDLASFPDVRTGRDKRVTNWNTAVDQGRIAALNMTTSPENINQNQAGEASNHRSLLPFVERAPTVVTEFFGKRLEFVGVIDTLEHSIVEGDIDGMKFVVYYVNQRDEITGVLNVGRPEVTAAVKKLMCRGGGGGPDGVSQMPKASEVIIGLVNAENLVKRSKMC
eukprot:g8358.t1